VATEGSGYRQQVVEVVGVDVMKRISVRSVAHFFFLSRE
jgi:hypothetical protein